MHITINHASQFRDQFHACNRYDQFSYEALDMLYEYLEDVNPDYELDVIALCCEYTEAMPEEIARDYSIDLNDADPEADDYADQCQALVMEFLASNTSLAGVTTSGSILFANF